METEGNLLGRSRIPAVAGLVEIREWKVLANAGPFQFCSPYVRTYVELEPLIVGNKACRKWASEVNLGAGEARVELGGGPVVGGRCWRIRMLLKSAKRLCGRAAKTKRTSWTSRAEPARSAKSAKHEQPQYRIEASGTAPFATAAGAQRQQMKMILALQACMSSLYVYLRLSFS